MSWERSAPAARYLCEDERWRPRTWRHFRYAVLRRLRDHGALSIEEIAAAPPLVLFLPLNRDEIVATCDSARRLGLIAPLNPAASREALAARTQWVLTDDGRRTIRHGLPWVFDKLGGLSKWGSIAALIFGLLSTGAVLSWLHERDSAEIAFGVEVVLGLVVGIFSLALALRSRSAGAEARRSTSQDWRRWQRERPEWSQIATRHFPLWSTLAAVPVFALVEAGLLLLGLEDFWFQAIPWLALLALAFPAIVWFARWNDIEEAAGKLVMQQAASELVALEETG